LEQARRTLTNGEAAGLAACRGLRLKLVLAGSAAMLGAE
jgi:hypothetical protein